MDLIEHMIDHKSRRDHALVFLLKGRVRRSGGETCQGFLACVNPLLQLGVLHFAEDLLEGRAGRVTRLDQIVAGDQAGGLEVLGRVFA